MTLYTTLLHKTQKNILSVMKANASTTDIESLVDTAATAATNNSVNGVAQSFTVGANAMYVGAVIFKLGKANDPNSNMTVTIRSGSQTGSVVATSQTIHTSTLSAYSSPSEVIFKFSSAVTLTASTQYWAVLSFSVQGTLSETVEIRRSSTSSYSGGEASYFTSGVWQNQSYDYYFRVLPWIQVGNIQLASDIKSMWSTSRPTTTLTELFDPSLTGGAESIVSSTDQLAQTFSTIGGTFSAIKVKIAKQGSPSFGLKIEIRTTSSDLPTSTVLASKTIPAASIPSGTSIITVGFGSNITTTNGTKYAVVYTWETGGSGDGSNFYQVPVTGLSQYSGGGTVSSSGSTWVAENTVDYYVAFLLQGSSKYIDILTQETTGRVSYHNFDSSTDTWTIKNEFVTLPSIPASADVGVSHVVLSDGAVVVLYQNGANVYYIKRSSSGTWGTATSVRTTGTAGMAALGLSDRTHFFYMNTGSTTLYHRSLTFTASLNAEQTVDSTIDSTIKHLNGTAASTTSGTIAFPYTDSSGTVSVVKFTSADSPTFTIDTAVSDASPFEASTSTVAQAVTDGTNIYMPYVDSNTQDIYLDKNDGTYVEGAAYSQTTSDIGTNYGGTGPGYAVGWKITNGSTAIKIQKIDFWISKLGTPTDSTVAKIYSDSSGIGSLLATSTNSFTDSELTTTTTQYSFLFNSIQIGASTSYWITLERTGSADNSNRYNATYLTTGGTANTFATKSDTGTWSYSGTAPRARSIITSSNWSKPLSLGGVNNAGNGGYAFGLTGGFQYAAEDITTTGTVVGFNVKIWKQASPTDNVVLQVRNDNSGNPGSTILATGSMPGSILPTSSAWAYIQLDTPVVLTGSTVWLTMTRSGAADGTNYYWWEQDNTTGSARSSADASTWSSLTATLRWEAYSDGDVQIKDSVTAQGISAAVVS